MKKSGLLKFAKKGSKKIKKSRGGSGAGKQKYPPGIRIGVFGHENTSKTVYLTVLYHQSKIDKKVKLTHLNIGHFKSGAYLLKLINERGSTTRKVIVD